MKRKAAIYVRESTDRQDWKAQLEQCNNYCKSNGIEVYKTYKDIASGAKNNRTEFLLMQEDMEQNKFDVIVVWELSRSTRDFITYKYLIQRLNDLGIELHSVLEGVLTEDDIDQEFSNDIKALINSHERKRTAKRVKSRMEHIAKNGNWTGGPAPFGYVLEDKKLIADEGNVEKAREIFRLYLSGENIADISRMFGFHDIKRVRRMLRNPVYIGKLKFRQQEVVNGKLVYNKNYEVVEGIHQAIIDEGLFYAVQKLLKDNKRNMANSGTYLFTKVKCQCGGRIYGSTRREKSKTRISYGCINNCGRKIIDADEFLEDVIEELEKASESFYCLEELDKSEYVNQTKLYKSELRKLEKQEKMLLDKYLEDRISEKLYDAQSEKLKLKREGLERELKRLENIKNDRKARESNRELLRDYLKRIRNIKSRKTLKRVLELIIDEIEFINDFRFVIRVNFLD